MVAADPDTDRTVALRKARFKVRLRRAAEACGYENLYQLGRVCGISKDSFKKYLSGTRLPNYECILRLALALGVPIPIIFLIFPALFGVLLAPAAMSAIQAMSSL